MTGVGTAEYTVGSTAYWTDQQLDEVLAQRVSARLIQLPVQVTPSTDEQGRIVWQHGFIPRFAGVLDVESVVITDIRGAAIEGVEVEADGRLTFAESLGGHPVYASGLAYDLNAAAADVCDTWAGAVTTAGLYDVTVDGQSFKRSQGVQRIADRASHFRGLALPKTIRMTRRDVVRRNRRRQPANNLAGRVKPWFDQLGRR